MITIDFECKNQHKFEGCFSDYEAYKKQQEKGIIRCPLCNNNEIRRIFTGCSIQARRASGKNIEKRNPGFLERLNEFNKFVKENFEDVGDSFAEKARAIHYGIEEDKNIYGKATPVETKELLEEGIGFLPVVDTEKIIN